MIPRDTFKTPSGNVRSEIDAVNWAIYHNDAFEGLAKKKQLPPINRWGNSAFFIKMSDFISRDVMKTTISIIEEMGYEPRSFGEGQVVTIGGLPQRMWGEVLIFPDSDHAWSDLIVDAGRKIVPKPRQVKRLSSSQVDDLEKFVNLIEKFIKENQEGGEMVRDYEKRHKLENSVLKLKKILKENFGKVNTPKYNEYQPLSKVEAIIKIARDEIAKARSCSK